MIDLGLWIRIVGIRVGERSIKKFMWNGELDLCLGIREDGTLDRVSLWLLCIAMGFLVSLALPESVSESNGFAVIGVNGWQIEFEGESRV